LKGDLIFIYWLQEEKLCVEIIDTGVGIDKVRKPLLFKLYGEIKDLADSKNNSNGMGLFCS
jgi:K+-sensing histidine kinase KdpD